jgi:thymidylate synthase ThyX
MDPKAFERTLRARAFDVSRGLLPLATITSLGQVVSARVLERQISRLLSDPLPEVQRIGAELKQACLRPAEQPLAAKRPAAVGAASVNGNGVNGSHDHAEGDALPAAPTLVKYTAPSAYQQAARAALEVLTTELLASIGEPDRASAVELGEPSRPEDEAVATLLYRHDRAGHSYRQVQSVVWALTPEQKQAVLAAAVNDRGPHDGDLPRELQSGYAFAYDLLMDVGSFRDLHRHRRCVQIVQEPTAEHGAEPAAAVFPRAFGSEIGRAALEADIGDAYDRAVEAGLAASREIAAEAPLAGPYLLPLAARIRALFKMDASQAIYISELRTGAGGHFSYRQIAWEMYEALRERAPSLAALARPTALTDPPDLLRR